MSSYFENEFSINPSHPLFEKYFKPHTLYERDEFYYRSFLEQMIEIHIENKNNENKISYYEMMDSICDFLVQYEKNCKEEFKNKVILEFSKNEKIFNYSK